MHIAWYSEDKPFAVGYADGKLLIGSKEPLDKGAIVVIDAHKVESCCLSVYVVILSFKFQKERAVLLSARWIRCTFIADADSKSFVRSRSAAWSGVQRVRCCWRVLKRRLWNCGPIQTPALTPALAGTAYRALDTPPWLMVWPGAACLGAVRSPSACSLCTLTLNVPSVLFCFCYFSTQNDYFEEQKFLWVIMLFRCCQNGLVSVWTVPQDISNFTDSCSSESEGWWENEAKPKLMVFVCFNFYCKSTLAKVIQSQLSFFCFTFEQ